MRRKNVLANSEIYHVFNKSISGYKIFLSEEDFRRIKRMLLYYQISDRPMQFSNYVHLSSVKSEGFTQNLKSMRDESQNLVQIIAYCIMPTHFHFILKQLKNNGITEFMGNLLNSYSRYFNIKRKRTGPLWVGRFKSVLVKTDEQLMHLTRYVHLNPVTASLIKKPNEWEASSYGEYTGLSGPDDRICDYDGLLSINRDRYKIFVSDGIEYQKELVKIKALLFD